MASYPDARPRRPFEREEMEYTCSGLLLDLARLVWQYAVRPALSLALSACCVLLTGARSSTLVLASWQRTSQKRPKAVVVADALLRLARHNLVPQRVFSAPHVVVVVWVVLLLWGERWNFHTAVAQCHWDHWETWPAGATPHHLVFVADPQLIDAHSYPGRPWPVNDLTILVTDNYMRRSYRELQEQLRPDTVFFLGDLFDGGREWKTLHGAFQDPSWSRRPEHERGYARSWRKRYGEDYWLREYARFGDIFLDPSMLGGSEAGTGQRGRRVITSLPGNHDLGFGSEVKLPVRQRFETYFGEGNRVHVIGNHTFVSVDSVSLSADTSAEASEAEVEAIFRPTRAFLEQVAWAKTKAVARELRVQRGAGEGVSFAHIVEDLDAAHFDVDGLKKALGGASAGQADLPTVLLTHVPLYRPPGTPCGPLREHWPPAKPSPDTPDTPVFPDHRNAISVSRGYQYQNVLSEADSVDLVATVGNVVHAFSGDDHDYCAVVHDAAQQHVPEITVKAFSMAMGVPTPGFLMVSLYNPIDETGHTLSSAESPTAGGPPAPPVTMQTHLCLLPSQLGTFARYGGMVVVTLVSLGIYAVLSTVMGWTVFAFDALADDGAPGMGMGMGTMPSSVLPMFHKAKVEDDEYRGGTSKARFGGTGSGSSSVPATYTRGRQPGPTASPYGPTPTPPLQSLALQKSRKNVHAAHGPTIQIARDDDDSDSDSDSVTGDDYLADGHMVNISLGGSRTGRWQPAARRDMLGRAMAFLAGTKRALKNALGLRGGHGRRRYANGGVRALFTLNGPLNGRGTGYRRSGHASQNQRLLHAAGWEFYAMLFRVAWMVVGYWGWLNHQG